MGIRKGLAYGSASGAVTGLAAAAVIHALQRMDGVKASPGQLSDIYGLLGGLGAVSGAVAGGVTGYRHKPRKPARAHR